MKLSKQVLDLKAENAKVCDKLELFKKKVTLTEDSNLLDQSSSVVANVLHESIEHSKCFSNIIVYGICVTFSDSAHL